MDKKLRSKADKLCAAYIKSINRCEASGWRKNKDGSPSKCSSRYEWAHIITRGCQKLRHDPRNSLCLCNVCHRWFTMHPLEFAEFVNERFNGRYDELRLESNQPKKGSADEWFGKWIEYYKENPTR